MTDLVEATSALVAATGQIVGTKAEMLAWSVGTAGGGPNGDGRYPFTAADNTTVLVPSPAALLQAGQSSRGIYATTAKALSKGVTSATITAAGTGGTTGTYALAFSGGAGSGAVGTFTVAAGKVISIWMMAPGDSYTSAPTLSFAACPGLTGATGVATIAANISVGQYFSVPVAGSNDALILYRVDAGPVATEVVRYPSSAVLPALAGRGSAFIVPPSPASGLWPLVSVQLYSRVGGVALTIPAQITVRDFGRDGIDRFRLRLAGFTAPSTYVEIAAEGVSLNISAAGFTGVKYLPLYAVGTSLGVPAGTLIGIARVDFGTGGTFGAYFANNITWAVGGLYVDAMTPNAAQLAEIDGAIPANVVISWLNQRGGLFKTLPTASSPVADQGLLACVDITMLPAYSLTGMTFVQECARDGINRFRCRVATWDGTTATAVAKESIAGGANLSVVGMTGIQVIPLYAMTGNPWGASTSTIVGYATINFLTGGAFGTFVTALTYAVGALFTERLSMSGAQLSVTNALTEAALATEAVLAKGPFRATVRDRYLRKMVQRGWAYYVPPGHDVGISQIETSTTRVTVTQTDFTIGQVVAQYRLQSTAAFTGNIAGTTLTVTAKSAGSIDRDQSITGTGITAGTYIVAQLTGAVGGVGTYQVNASQTAASTAIVGTVNYARLPTQICLRSADNGLAGYSGMETWLTMDWSQSVISGAAVTWASAANCGLDPASVFDPGAGARILTSDDYQEVIYVDDEDTTPGAFLAAVNAVTFGGPQSTGGGTVQYHPKHAHLFHRVAIVLRDGRHKATNVYRPDHVDFIAEHPGKAWFEPADSSGTTYMLHSFFNGGIRGMRWDQNVNQTAGGRTGQCCIHLDEFSYKSRPATITGLVGQQLYRAYQRNVGLDFDNGDVVTIMPVGMGFPSGATLLFEECTSRHEWDGFNEGGWSGHSSPDSVMGGRLILRNCREQGFGYLAALASNYAMPRCYIDIEGSAGMIATSTCNFPADYLGQAAANLPIPQKATDMIPIRFRSDGSTPIYYGTAEGRMDVLETTPGAAVSGSALAATFGKVNSRGRGELVITDYFNANNGISLGQRLGNCTSVNKSLTIGAQTHVFANNYTAMTTNAIVTEMNGSFTVNAVARFDAGSEIVPECANMRQQVSGHGSAMLRGVLLDYDSNGKVVPAAAGAARVFGVGRQKHLPGKVSAVDVGQAVPAALIPEIGTTIGEFGVGSNGRLSFAATPKVGRVIGRAGNPVRVEFYR